MNRLQAVILAAGKSTRFNTQKSKLTETICGQEMILYPTKLFESLNISTALVVGYQKDEIINLIKKHHDNKIEFIEQKEQLGTGHAVATTKSWWKEENLLIVNGDMPLIKEDTIKHLWEKHLETNAVISFVVAHNIDPSITSYGRVIEEDGKIKIIEAKDDAKKDRTDCCINAGIYLVKTSFLQKAIDSVEKSSATGEFYITKLIEMANDKNLTVATTTESFDTIRGINTLRELWIAEQIKRSELIQFWMANGVRFSTAQNITIDLNVSIGKGTYVGPSIQLTGKTKIGEYCHLEGLSVFDNVTIEENVFVAPNCVIKNSTLKKNSQVWPFCNLFCNAIIKEGEVVESYTEIIGDKEGFDYDNQFIAAKAVKIDSSGFQV